MKAMTLIYDINAPAQKVWDALVNPKLIEEWSGASALMEAKVGTKFSLWGGSIYGVNTEVIVNKKLVQDWFEGGWEEASIATFTLEETENGTRLTLIHENVPESSFDSIREGWDIYYLEPLKDLAENME